MTFLVEALLQFMAIFFFFFFFFFVVQYNTF